MSSSDSRRWSIRSILWRLGVGQWRILTEHERIRPSKWCKKRQRQLLESSPPENPWILRWKDVKRRKTSSPCFGVIFESCQGSKLTINCQAVQPEGWRKYTQNHIEWTETTANHYVKTIFQSQKVTKTFKSCSINVDADFMNHKWFLTDLWNSSMLSCKDSKFGEHIS